MFARFAFAAALLLCVSHAATCSARVLSQSDYRRMVTFHAPAISADARYGAVIVSRVDWNDDRRIASLLIVKIATRTTREFLSGRKGLSSPAYSPDGSRLAILANDASGHSQVYVMPAGGGTMTQVTHSPTDVDEYAWRPDGQAFVYAATDPAPKRTGADRFRDSFVFTTEPIVARSAPRPDHLFVGEIGGGPARQLTFGTQSVAGDSLSWSPDGKAVAFTIAPNAITNDQSYSRAALVDVSMGRLRLLTSHTMWDGSPLFSPDGHHIAYTYSAGDPQIAMTQLFVTTRSGGNGEAMWNSLDRPIGDMVWSSDSRSLLVAVPNATTIAPYRLPLGGTPVRLDVGSLTPGYPMDTTGGANTPDLQNALARDGTLLFIGSSTTQPPELFAHLPAGRIVRLTGDNAAFSAFHLARAERLTFATSTGVRGDAVLYRPPNFSARHRYPLVVFIHGGPGDPSMQIFDFWAQVMAARGWLVLRPNYRGTPNLGLTYQHAILYDPEDGPGKDIMAALAVVRARGIVDSRRIAVCGWSYGGIMTAWMIAKYHFWNSAVSGASVDDWITDYGTADDSLADRDILHGSPFVGDNATEWRAVSAISYAHDVTTPVLILSDIGDNRDPFASSSMYWRALRDNHKDATLRVWPVDGHFPDDPVRKADIYSYWIAFIARHFR